MRLGKSYQLAHPKPSNHAAVNVSFRLVNEDLMAPLKPKAHGSYKYASKITDQFTGWTAVYFLCSKD